MHLNLTRWTRNKYTFDLVENRIYFFKINSSFLCHCRSGQAKSCSEGCDDRDSKRKSTGDQYGCDEEEKDLISSTLEITDADLDSF